MSCVDHNEVMILTFLRKLDIKTTSFMNNISNLGEKIRTLPRSTPFAIIYRIYFNITNKN
jgi:hypothetical protein